VGSIGILLAPAPTIFIVLQSPALESSFERSSDLRVETIPDMTSSKVASPSGLPLSDHCVQLTDGSSQDPNVNRTAISHRASMSSATSSAYPRQMHPRTHSHSLSVGSINPVHRVSRRKSMTSTATNKEAVMSPMETSNFSARRASKSGTGSRATPAFPASLPSGSGFAQGGFEPKSSIAIVDGPSLATLPENEKGNSKARIRRASEGSRLSKGEGKRTGGAELRCEKCGKGYKHSSCLTKHLSVSHNFSHYAAIFLCGL